MKNLSTASNDIGRQLFIGENHPRGIFVLDADLAVLLVTFARAHNLLPGKDYHMLVFDYIDELRNTPGICMMRQQLNLMHKEVHAWLENSLTAKSKPLQKYIKTELLVP